MRKAYIVLAHKSPDHLYRLIDRLDDHLSTFFVHIDRKTPIDSFVRLRDFGEKVMIVKRVASNWAEFGLVQATLNAMKAIRDSGFQFDRITLLSGQDYPIKDNAYINHFFATTNYSVFLEYVSIPDSRRWNPGGGMYRMNKYFLGFKWHQRLLAKAINLLARYFPLLKRSAPAGTEAYGGSQWWTMDMYALEYVLNYVATHPGYAAFHRFTFAPDEIFFHSILLNAKDERLQKSIVNDNKRFMSWEDTNQDHPDFLTVRHMHKILHSDALFARKIDPDQDPEICNLIDENCLQYPPVKEISEPEDALRSVS